MITNDYYKDYIKGFPELYKRYDLFTNTNFRSALDKRIGKKIFEVTNIDFHTVWDIIFWEFFFTINTRIIIPKSIIEKDENIKNSIKKEIRCFINDNLKARRSMFHFVKDFCKYFAKGLYWELSVPKISTGVDLLVLNDSPHVIEKLVPILNKIHLSLSIEILHFKPFFKKSGENKIGTRFDQCNMDSFNNLSDFWKTFQVACTMFQRRNELKEIFTQQFGNDFKNKEIIFIFVSFTDLVLLAVRYYLLCKRLISKKRPNAVLVSNDHSCRWRALVVAANNLDIPTFHYPHSAMNATWAYSNIRAKTIFVGGKADKQHLMNMGYQTDNIIITGRAIAAYFLPTMTKRQIKNKITIFSMNVSYNSFLFDQVVENISSAFTDYEIYFQTYPGENIDKYPKAKKLITSSRIHRSETYGNQENLRTSYITIVSLGSNICLDSIFSQKLTIAYDMSHLFSSRASLPYERYNSCFIVNNIEEIVQAVKKIMSSKIIQTELIENCKRMKDDYFADIGEEERANIILRTIKDRIQKENPSSL